MQMQKVFLFIFCESFVFAQFWTFVCLLFAHFPVCGIVQTKQLCTKERKSFFKGF